MVQLTIIVASTHHECQGAPHVAAPHVTLAASFSVARATELALASASKSGMPEKATPSTTPSDRPSALPPSQPDPEDVVISAPFDRLAGLSRRDSLGALLPFATMKHDINYFMRSKRHPESEGFWELGLLEAILEHMRGHLGVTAVQKQGCQALCNFTLGDGPVTLARAKLAAEAGALETIIAAMIAHPASLGLQQLACHALNGLISGDDGLISGDGDAKGYSREQRSAEVGAIEAVVAGMERHRRNAELQEQGCIYLCSISCGVDADAPARVQRTAMSGALECIISAMNAYVGNASVQLQGCQALRNVTSGDDAAGLARAQRAANGGALEAIGMAMRVHIDHVMLQEQACVALYNITSGTDAAWLSRASNLLTVGGLLDAVVTAMNRYETSVELQIHGGIALMHIVGGADIAWPKALRSLNQGFSPNLPPTPEVQPSAVRSKHTREAAATMPGEAESTQEERVQESAPLVQAEQTARFQLVDVAEPAAPSLLVAQSEVTGAEATGTNEVAATEQVNATRVVEPEPATSLLVATIHLVDVDAASMPPAPNAPAPKQELSTAVLHLAPTSDDDKELGDPGEGWQLCEDGGYIPLGDSHARVINVAMLTPNFSPNWTSPEKCGVSGMASLPTQVSRIRREASGSCSTMASEGLRLEAEAILRRTWAASTSAEPSAWHEILQCQSRLLSMSPAAESFLDEFTEHLAKRCHSAPPAQCEHRHSVLPAGDVSISAVSATSQDSVNTKPPKGTPRGELNTRPPQTPRSMARSRIECSFRQSLRDERIPGANEDDARLAMTRTIITHAASMRAAKQQVEVEEHPSQRNQFSMCSAVEREAIDTWAAFERGREERVAAMRWFEKQQQAEQVAARANPASEWKAFDRATDEKAIQARRAAQEIQMHCVACVEQAAPVREAAVARAVEYRDFEKVAAMERSAAERACLD